MQSCLKEKLFTMLIQFIELCTYLFMLCFHEVLHQRFMNVLQQGFNQVEVWTLIGPSQPLDSLYFEAIMF